MSIEVSVCIPTYNRKVYLKETLESVLSQNYKDYEILIVDDGSTDGTDRMLKESGFPVRYYWQENSGDADARNKLIELARGKYISFLDSDDLLIPNALERMMQVINNEKEDVVVYGSYFNIDHDGNIIRICKRKLYSGNVTKYLFQDILIHSCGALVTRKALEKAGGFDTSFKVCSDYDLWLRLSLKYKFIGLADPTFKRRRHSENLSARSVKNRITELKVLERFYYEKGGSGAVPVKIAKRRLSREEYRIGMAAIEEKKLKTAKEFFWKSFGTHVNLKSLLRLGQVYIK